MSHPWIGRTAISALFAVLLLASLKGWNTDRFEGRIVDDATGQPLAATLAAFDADGRRLEIEGKHAHVEYLGKRRCYVDGSFALNAPRGRVTLEVRRGLETIPIMSDVEVSAGSKQPLMFRLKRWIDMRKHGFISGDTHVHYLSQADSHLQMRAEDLNVLNLLVSDFTNDRPKFTGKLDPVSTPEHQVFVGQESRDWQNGHVILLRIRKIIEPFAPFGGRFGERTEPNLLMARILKNARDQGGVTTWAHFCNLPGAESPIDIALGLVDAVDLITYDDPTGLPSHWGPWVNSGMSQGEFTVMRSMDLYYQYLNAGIQLPIGAGTDKMGDNIPVGSNRLYARVAGDPAYDKWIAGLKTGNGFVTNGPMVTFDVDGHGSGDVVRFTGTRKLKVRATARSVLPFQSLEIVANGETALVRNFANPNRPDAEGIYSLELEGTVELNRSTWLAARVADSPARRNRILPRELTVFAHTNPVYFHQDGKRVRVLPAIEYLQRYVKGTIHWLNTGAKFRDSAEGAEALRLAQQAQQFYSELAK